MNSLSWETYLKVGTFNWVGKRRDESARMFSCLLSLVSQGRVDVEQEEPFGDIKIGFEKI